MGAFNGLDGPAVLVVLAFFVVIGLLARELLLGVRR